MGRRRAYSARATWSYGGDMASYDRRKFVLDFWLRILLAMATIFAVALLLTIPLRALAPSTLLAVSPLTFNTAPIV
jgi:hypothetical protein